MILLFQLVGAAEAAAVAVSLLTCPLFVVSVDIAAAVVDVVAAVDVDAAAANAISSLACSSATLAAVLDDNENNRSAAAIGGLTYDLFYKTTRINQQINQWCESK